MRLDFFFFSISVQSVDWQHCYKYIKSKEVIAEQINLYKHLHQEIQAIITFNCGLKKKKKKKCTYFSRISIPSNINQNCKKLIICTEDQPTVMGLLIVSSDSIFRQ